MNGRESNAALTAKVADLERRLAAIEALISGKPPPHYLVEAWASEAARMRLSPDTRVSDAVRARERDLLGRRGRDGRTPRGGSGPAVYDRYTVRRQLLGRKVGLGGEYTVQNPDWYPSGYYAEHRPIAAILAEYFGIDQVKIEAEKRAMLDALRAAT